MELRHLRYFVTLARELHFARAAKQLGISQPPLSQQIRALEAELGTSLFVRTSRRTKLTDAGLLFLGEAEKILAQANHAQDIVRRATRGETGELNIGFTPSAPLTRVFRSAIQGFRAGHPNVRLALHELPTQDQIEALTAGHLQISLLRTGAHPPLISKPLTAVNVDREELVVVMRADHPLAKASPNTRMSLSRFSDDAFVLFPREFGGATYDQLFARCRRDGFEPRVLQEAREVVTLLGLVSAGLGITVVAASFGEILLNDLVIRRLKQPVLVAETWLAYSKDDQSPLTRKFVGLISEFVKQASAR